MESKQFKCYSRKLMYFLGIHNINYIDKYYNNSNGKPYWLFDYNDELTAVLTKWEDFKQNQTI